MNAGDKRQVKSLRELERLIHGRRQDALRALMSTEAGRLVVWAWLSDSGLYSSVFDTQTVRMAAMAGQQAFGQKLLAEVIAVDEELYELMAREARLRARQDEAQRRAIELEAERENEGE